MVLVFFIGSLLTLLIPSATPARAAAVPPGVAWSEEYFPSLDGTMLHADVFVPAGLSSGGRVPVILIVSPYLNSGGAPFPGETTPTEDGPKLAAPELVHAGIFERGYALVQVSLRGFGASEGCHDLGGTGEQGDVHAAVEWAASRPWSTGRVGMWGGSYVGWTQIMALASRPAGLAAIIPEVPVISAYRFLYMNRNRYWVQGTPPDGYLTSAIYDLYDMVPPSLLADSEQQENWREQLTANPRCYADNLVAPFESDPNAAFWRERDLIQRASGSNVPVLWTHGLLDAAVRPDNFLDVWSALRGPRHGWFGQWSHQGAAHPNVGRDGFLDEALRWLDRYVKGVPEDLAPVESDPKVTVEDGLGRWRAEDQWPPADARPLTMPLKPGAYLDVAGNEAEGFGGPTGVGSWSFTQPLPYDVHLAGPPRLAATVTTAVPGDVAGVNLIALVYDVDPLGRATLITRGAYVVPKSSTLSFELYPQDWPVRAGHRLGVLFTGADDTTFTPGTTGTTVRVMNASVTYSFLRERRVSFLDGDPSLAFRMSLLLRPCCSGANRYPIAVDQATIAANTVQSPLPPPMG